MAVTIVENEAVTFAKGFGTRALGKPEPVDADTLFQTGSTGKAFTVAALGILVDAGKLSWDDKVTDRLPGFQMYDPWVTREMTLRDLLVHRTSNVFVWKAGPLRSFQSQPGEPLHGRPLKYYQ